VEPGDIEVAYVPLVEALLDGRFRQPDEGWNADQIGAHVALNNDVISAAAISLLALGHAAYDNEVVVADGLLLAYAEQLGGRSALAADVRRSAADLASAYASLLAAGSAGTVPIPTVIHHEGRTIRDDLGPVTSLIEGNATFHLAMHFQQLLALQAE
jgi:hypothetical protein